MDKYWKTSNITGERIKKYLESGKRFDNRKHDEFREISIELGVSKNAEGSAKVKIGKTEVLVGVKMDTGTPYADSPNKGNLMVTAELLPLSSSRFEYGPPKFEAIELGRVTDRGLRESKFIDFEKLCIVEGEKVWTVFVDIYSINDDGNLIDAAGIGALAALKSAKIPKYDKEKEQVLYGEWTEEKVPLKNMPVSLSIYKIGDNLIVDPTREEEDIAEARITMGVCDKDVSSLQKSGLGSFSVEEFEKAISMGEKVSADIFKKIDKLVK